jgi:hypothetical protein
MKRINYTSHSYVTIVLEVPWDNETECVPPPQIVIHRRGDNGVTVPEIYHHRGDRQIRHLQEPSNGPRPTD